MDQSTKSTASLFDVYLRLRPSLIPSAERFLDVEADDDTFPKHITIKPPSTDHRKRAVEKFAFTRVFEENASQLDLFTGTGALPLIQSVLAADGQAARDGLLATLGVTGSGKVTTLHQKRNGCEADIRTESYHSGFQEPARLDSNGTRRFVLQHISEHRTSYLYHLSIPFSCCRRCL